MGVFNRTNGNTPDRTNGNIRGQNDRTNGNTTYK